MRSLVLFSILLMPSFLAAQNQDSERPWSPWSALEAAVPKATNPFTAEPAQPQQLQGGGTSAALVPRPGMSGSSTGYVDNAIVGSQIRFRFDAGFEVQAPDRAEFFYAKCGCYRELGVDPNAPGPSPRLNGRDPARTRFIETGADYREFRMGLDYALNSRFSLFAELPVRSISPEVNDDATGIGDVQAGLKLGLVASDESHVTFQFRAYFPSGKARRGLGTDHSSIEPALLLNQRLGDKAALAGELGVWIPIGGSSSIPASSGDFAGNIFRYGFGLSYDLVNTSDGVGFSPVFELVGWRVLGGYESGTVDGTLSTFSLNRAEGTNVVNAKFGGRVTFQGNHSIYVGYGMALSEAEWYEQIVRFEYRFAF